MAESETFTEGPVFDAKGRLFFSHRDGIYVVENGRRSEWVRDPAAGFNGHKVLPDGTHIVCAARKGAIWKFDAAGRKLGVVAEGLRAPNDIALDGDRGFYFTDPGGSREAPIGTVHYVGPEGAVQVGGGMRVPNGLVLSRDGRYLYVSETVPNRILRFQVIAPGKLGPMEVFADLPRRDGAQAEPDGLAIDGEGNLYVAHLAMSVVQVLSPQGKVLRRIPAGVYDVSNLVFRGNSLFITGAIGHRRDTPGRVMRVDLTL